MSTDDSDDWLVWWGRDNVELKCETQSNQAFYFYFFKEKKSKVPRDRAASNAESEAVSGVPGQTQVGG